MPLQRSITQERGGRETRKAIPLGGGASWTQQWVVVFSLAQEVGSVSPREGLLWEGVRNVFNLDPALLRKCGQIGGELSFEL